MKGPRLSDLLEEEIRQGLQGNNVGLPMGLDRLSEELTGIQRRRYDLIGGDIGSGKTAFLDNSYVLNPYDYLEKNPNNKTKLSILYFSMEIDAISKIAKLMSRKIFMDYGMLIPTKVILSKGQKNRLPQDVYNVIQKLYPYFDKLEDTVLEFRDESLTPGKFYHTVKDYSKKHGRWVDDPKRTVLSDDGKTEFKAQLYIPNDPNVIHLIIADHLGLIGGTGSKKQNIEQLSQYMVWYRNRCGFSAAFVQQYNRSLQGADRTKLQMLEPRLADFKETASTQEDANTVVALFSPNRYKVQDFYGMQVPQLKNRLRAAYILKNRDGEEGLHVPLNFFGEAGHFREFPKYDTSLPAPQEFYQFGNDINLTLNGRSSINPGPVGYGKVALNN